MEGGGGGRHKPFGGKQMLCLLHLHHSHDTEKAINILWIKLTKWMNEYITLLWPWTLQVKIITLAFACKQTHSEQFIFLNVILVIFLILKEKKKAQHKNLKSKCICFQVPFQVTNSWPLNQCLYFGPWTGKLTLSIVEHSTELSTNRSLLICRIG